MFRKQNFNILRLYTLGQKNWRRNLLHSLFGIEELKRLICKPCTIEKLFSWADRQGYELKLERFSAENTRSPTEDAFLLDEMNQRQSNE